MVFSFFDNFMFTGMPIIMVVFFIVFTGVIVFSLGKAAREHFRNNAMEEVTVPARIITKRTHVWGGHGDAGASTSYYVTFEDEQGERIEFSVGSKLYGMYAEGDKGMLAHQGTRFIHFERDRF